LTACAFLSQGFLDMIDADPGLQARRLPRHAEVLNPEREGTDDEVGGGEGDANAWVCDWVGGGGKEEQQSFGASSVCA